MGGRGSAMARRLDKTVTGQIVLLRAHASARQSPTKTLPGGRQVRGKTRPVDRNVGHTAPDALRRQPRWPVHRCEGQAARKLAFIL